MALQLSLLMICSVSLKITLQIQHDQTWSISIFSLSKNEVKQVQVVAVLSLVTCIVCEERSTIFCYLLQNSMFLYYLCEKKQLPHTIKGSFKFQNIMWVNWGCKPYKLSTVEYILQFLTYSSDAVKFLKKNNKVTTTKMARAEEGLLMWILMFLKGSYHKYHYVFTNKHSWSLKRSTIYRNYSV